MYRIKLAVSDLLRFTEVAWGTVRAPPPLPAQCASLLNYVAHLCVVKAWCSLAPSDLIPPSIQARKS